jgi:hypothetical protein
MLALAALISSRGASAALKRFTNSTPKPTED